jgi:hypothetical protein
VEALPDSFELAGQMIGVGCDSVPQNDLETNYRYERTVYASPNDETRIYADNLNTPSEEEPHDYYEFTLVQSNP